MQRGMHWLLRIVAAVVVTMSVVNVASSQDKMATPEINNLQAQLKAAETAFAKTMADRDHAAFANFVADEAIFFGRAGEIRGKSAVVGSWKGLFEGKNPPFSWRPETAVVLDSGTLGLTSGPVFSPEGKQTGTFQSVWRRTGDGRWEIVFDKGCPYCEEK